MWLYLIIFFVPVIAYVGGKPDNRNRLFLISYMTALALFVGLSDMFGGYDRYIYGDVFDNIANGITNGNAYGTIVGMSFFEPMYSALCYLIAMITTNRYIYILIITLLIYFCLYKAFKNNAPNYPLAIVIFLGLAFFFSFTYLRQVLAYSVAWWLGTAYMLANKKWKFLALAIFVMLLHKSGIVFALLLFVPLKKWKPSIVVLVLAICAAVGATGVTGSMYDTFADVSELASKGTYATDTNLRLEYFLEVLFFVVIILANYNKIQPTRRNLIFLNMAWLFCAMLLLFVRSSDGGRVAWYFTFGIIYIITLICNTSQFQRKVKTGMSYMMIALMLALYVRIFNAWQPYNNLYPYKTFLTNGHRDPDYSWTFYEYDHRYDVDKFYRPAFRFLK